MHDTQMVEIAEEYITHNTECKCKQYVMQLHNVWIPGKGFK